VNSVNVQTMKVHLENTEPSRLRNRSEGVTTQAGRPDRSSLPARQAIDVVSARRFASELAGRRDSLTLAVTLGPWLKGHGAKVGGKVDGLENLTTTELQRRYDAADATKWSVYRTKNATSALAIQLGCDSKELRKYLASKGIDLRGADAAYVDGRQGRGVAEYYKRRSPKQERLAKKRQRDAKLNMTAEQHAAWTAKHRKSKAAWTDGQRAAFGNKVSAHRKRYLAGLSDDDIEAIDERLRKGRKRSIVVDGVRFDSTWEVPVYQLLQRLQVPFVYANTGDTKLRLHGLKRYWRPDFVFAERGIILDVKGDKRAMKKFWERDLPAFLMTDGPHLQMTLLLLTRKIQPERFSSFSDLIDACTPVYAPDKAFLVSRPVTR